MPAHPPDKRDSSFIALDGFSYTKVMQRGIQCPRRY
jgi:hypothetical protein